MHSEAHADLFDALADPMRRRIVDVLRAGEQPVNDIVAELDLHQSGVSRHLRILSEAGFVRMRADGPRRLYQLRPEPFRELETWINGYRRLWESRLDRLADELERRKRARANRKEKGS
jgi:DNA-binding transcriptional ArsR family regulator